MKRLPEGGFESTCTKCGELYKIGGPYGIYTWVGEYPDLCHPCLSELIRKSIENERPST